MAWRLARKCTRGRTNRRSSLRRRHGDHIQPCIVAGEHNVQCPLVPKPMRNIQTSDTTFFELHNSQGLLDRDAQRLRGAIGGAIVVLVLLTVTVNL
jgi:hypothetical protein